MLLDNKTLLFSLMLISSMLALSLSVVSKRGETDGIRRWAGALALEATVWLLVMSRGTIPDFYSILVANVLMASAQAMKLAALHAYRKMASPRLQCIAPVVASILLLMLLPYEDARMRMGLSSLIFAIQFVLILRVLWSDTDSRSGKAWWLLFGSTVVIVPLLAARAFATLAGTTEFVTSPQSPLAPNAVQLAIFVGLTALNLLGAMGFILMIKERGDREIRKLAMTDSLTHVLNRRAFLEQAEKQIAAALRYRLPLSLLMIDIDHFKHINDNYGHPAGDQVLIRITEQLSAILRTEDMLARYGGEEFCVLLPGTHQAGALALAEKLRLAVESLDIPLGTGHLSVTISIGLTVCDANCRGCPSSFDAMLQDADRALYLAKQKGRNRTVPLALGCTAPIAETSGSRVPAP